MKILKKMVVSKKFDYRQRKARNTFFGIPVLPLSFFLCLIVALLFLQQKAIITGRAIGSINLTKISYQPNQQLEGDLIINFRPGDLIPENSTFSININTPKCNHYYVCSDGQLVRWQFYNFSSKRCENYTTWQISPWYDECNENYRIYPNIYSNISCAGIGKKCCAPGTGVGYFYQNLNCSLGECWDACANESVKITKNLTDIIALSTTPFLGNYSFGYYRNADNLTQQFQPQTGWGFGACTQITGFIGSFISFAGVSPALPDLTVTDIYVDNASKLYAGIQNIGAAPAGRFIVKACWYAAGSVLECFFEQEIPGLNAGLGFYLDMGTRNVAGKTVQVIVDVYNNVVESNEANNEMVIYFIPLPDLTVTDIYVDSDTGKLYAVIKNIGNADSGHFVVRLCIYNKIIQCFDYEISSVGLWGLRANETYLLDLGVREVTGKKVQVIVDVYNNVVESNEANNEMVRYLMQPPGQIPPCNDTDKGADPLVKGACVQVIGGNVQYFPDRCIGPNLLEETFCSGTVCSSYIVNCSALNEGWSCVDGACVLAHVPIPLPDLIIEKIERTSDLQYAKIWIKNIGEATVNQAFDLLIEIEGKEKPTREIYTISTSLAPNSSYSISSSTNIRGIVAHVYAYVDFNNKITEKNENNNNASALLLPYSCGNWNNKYIVPLGRFGLKTPSKEGIYLLNFKFSYGGLVFSESSIPIIVTKPPVYYYRGCSNKKCVVMASSVPRNNTCETDADCEEYCEENWQYGAWSECLNGKKYRECYDANNCNTTNQKPVSCVQSGDKFIEIADCCLEDWQCDAWSACYQHHGRLVQSMTCRDVNNCNPQNNSYVQLRDCCVEDWLCTWGPCIHGKQTLICEDKNNCGTTFNKPQEETRACKETRLLPWWIWLVIAVVIAVIVIFATKFAKQGKKGETTLQSYIKKALAAGMSKEEIKKKLIDAGWSEKIVETELEKL